MLDGISILYLALFILCLLLSAFFSSAETAFISLQRVRIKHLVESGVSGADEVAKITKRPERLLTTILLGNNFVNIAAAALGTLLAITVLGPGWGVLVATIGVTLILLIFCEISPKILATRMGERLVFAYLRPIRLISWVLSPATTVLGGIGGKLAHLVGGKPDPRSMSE
jgi:Mg2+/Co2+ transporter CorB